MWESAAANRADLRGVNLRFADLEQVMMMNADLARADLREADLSYTSLNGVNLTRANLTEPRPNRPTIPRSVCLSTGPLTLLPSWPPLTPTRAFMALLKSVALQ